MRAAPADGAANEALLRLLAHELDVPRSVVLLERGQTSRTKTVRLTGVPTSAPSERWPGLDVR